MCVVVLGAAGCGVRGELPAGVTCSRWIQASGDAALAQALAAATSGTCVVAQSGKYQQALTVPAGVALVGEAGGAVELSGSGDASSVVSLGPRAVLAGVKVSAAAAGFGVSAGGQGARLFGVSVSGGRKVGVIFWCEEDCRSDEFSEVVDSTVSGASVGLMTRGVRVRVKNGAVSKNQSTSLRAGFGVVAEAGAVLELDGTSVDENDDVGVLIEGAGATEASLTNVSVRANRSRGVWAQGLTGTAAAPRLRLVNATLERNVLAGFGARGSTGIVVTGGRIAGTVVGPAQADGLGQPVMVGDGLGVFSGTGELRVEGVALEANQRAQALVDSATAGVVFAPTVSVTAGAALGVVVQRTSAQVEAVNVTRPAPGAELAVSAPALALPTR